MKSPDVPLWFIITGLGLTQIIGWGTSYFIIGTVSADIASATGWSQTLIFGAFTTALLVGGLLARRIGRLIDTHGGRWLVPLGSLLMALGAAIIGLFATKITYLLGWVLIGISMRLATYDPVFAALTQISREKARRSISALTLIGGFASTLFWPANHYLSQHLGWQNTFLVHAALNLFICVPVHIVLLREARPLPPDTRADDKPAPFSGQGRAVAIALLATSLAMAGFIYSALSAHIMPLFKGLGLSATQAVVVSSLIGPSQVFARLGEMVMGRNLHPAKLGLYAFAMVPVAFALMITSGFSYAGAIAFAMLYGAANGVITIVRGVVPLALFGRKGYAEVLGVLSAPNMATTAAAPLLFAWLLTIVTASQAMLLLGLAGIMSGGAMGWLYHLQRRKG